MYDGMLLSMEVKRLYETSSKLICTQENPRLTLSLSSTLLYHNSKCNVIAKSLQFFYLQRHPPLRRGVGLS